MAADAAPSLSTPLPSSAPSPSPAPGPSAARAEPTPLTDPHGYLALFKFNRKLARCPRTLAPVSYADIGDPDGTPVLFVPPSGCSRWFAAPQGQSWLRSGVSSGSSRHATGACGEWETR